LQRISNSDKIQNHSLTLNKVLNVLVDGSLRTSMISGSLKSN